MPAERLSMRKVREVLRLKHALGLSYRKISEATGAGKTQAAEYVRRAQAAGIGWPNPDGIDDTELERRLFPIAGESAQSEGGHYKAVTLEPGINRTYQDLADHYGCVVLPTRVLKPRAKATVEVAVQIVERFVLAKLRNRVFFSLADLNAAIRDCVATINAKVMRRFG